MKKFKNFITATMVCVMMATSAMTVSAAEMPADSTSAVESHVHVHDLEECELSSTYKACDHNGTLKGVTNVGTCSKCGGFLYYVYCTVCGKYTGATICLCR